MATFVRKSISYRRKSVEIDGFEIFSNIFRTFWQLQAPFAIFSTFYRMYTNCFPLFLQLLIKTL